jgi:hypothetical protein
VLFNYIESPTKFGVWGLLESQEQRLETAPKYQAFFDRLQRLSRAAAQTTPAAPPVAGPRPNAAPAPSATPQPLAAPLHGPPPTAPTAPTAPTRPTPPAAPTGPTPPTPPTLH